jgi:menaquinone-dependent protoporphyrinogen oxidase
MNVLIAVASKHGSTLQIAEAIADQLRRDNLDVDLHDLKENGDPGNVTGYNAVIVCSGVYAGSWLPEARRFTEHHSDELARMPVWLVSSGPLGTEDTRPRGVPETVIAPVKGVTPREHKIFAGRLDAADMGFGERLIISMVHAPTGDFRDWPGIEQWAHTIAEELRSVESAVK